MAAKIIRKNSYETWNVIYNNEKNKTTEKAGIIFQERDKAKKEQDAGIVLGGMHRLHYRRYLHDVTPLAIFMSYLNNDIRCFIAINTHYLTVNHSLLVIKMIKKKNTANIKQGRNLIITYDMIKALNLPILAYRNYKYDRTVPIEYIPIDDWDDVIRKERSPWQGKFYNMSQADIDNKKRAKRKKRSKRKKKAKRKKR